MRKTWNVKSIKDKVDTEGNLGSIRNIQMCGNPLLIVPLAISRKVIDLLINEQNSHEGLISFIRA